MTEQISGIAKIRRGLGKELQAITLAADGLLDIISGIIHIPSDVVNKVNGAFDNPRATDTTSTLEEMIDKVTQEFDAMVKKEQENTTI